MSLVEKLQSETSALLASVKAIVDTVATHGALLTETKNATTLTQNIVNLLTTGNVADESPMSPRADTLAGQLKALVVALIKHRRDALDKKDGVTAMRDLENTERAAGGIRTVVKNLLEEVEKSPSSFPTKAEATVADNFSLSMPKPAQSATVNAKRTSTSDPDDKVTVNLGASIRTPEAKIDPKEEPKTEEPKAEVTKEEPEEKIKVEPKKERLEPKKDEPKVEVRKVETNKEAPIVEAKKEAKEDNVVVVSSPAQTTLPTVKPAKEDSTSSISISSPDKPSPSDATPTSPSQSKYPSTVPAWQQKLLEKKKLDENLTPVKSANTSTTSASSSPAPWRSNLTPLKSATTAAVTPKTTSSATSTPAKSPEPSKASTSTTSTRSATAKDSSSSVKLTQTEVPAAKPSIHKVNQSGSSLSPALQKSVGINRMSGVKTLSVTLTASAEAIEKCNSAKDNTSVRAIMLKVDKEQLEFVSLINASGTAERDLEVVATSVPKSEPAYIFFRYSEGAAPWVLITWIPEETSVKEKMLYASSSESTKVMVGSDRVSKQVTINSVTQFKWEEIHEEPLKLKNKDDFLAEENDQSLPFSERELAQRQVDREERQARKEISAKAASGFHTVSYPLSAEAEDAVRGIAEGRHTWVQLSLDAGFKAIELRGTPSSPSVHDIPSLIHTSEPQFYLYTFREATPVLIYCCPENGPTIKNRMVYSTCKAALADNIKDLGISELKKLDIRDPKDLTQDELNSAYSSKASFKPSNTVPTNVQLAGPQVRTGPARYGGVSAIGGLGATIAGKAALKKTT